jgi:hypothetical protein
MIYLSILFFILSGAFEGVMDTLQFHYVSSKFYNFNNKTFWDPQISWMNKYKNNDSTMGEKFLGSTTIFVGLTDAWHLFKLFRNLSIFIGIFFIAIIPSSIIMTLIYILIIRTVFGLSFTLFYKILSNKIIKKNN